MLKYDGKEFQWVYDPVFQPRSTYSVDGWAYGAYNPIYGIGVDSKNDGHCLVTDLNSVYDIYYNESYKNVESLHGKTIKYDGEKYYSTTGLNCQHTYWVKEDPFNSEHLIICTTDLGLQISYDGGNSFKWAPSFNTCYDLYFDKNTENLVYGLWSSRHDAPYNPYLSDVNAKGGFMVSYDGGNSWDFTYSTGLPENSIPVKMCVVPNEDTLTIAVATFNNGFYISYDSGRTFESISEGMISYEGMIWGEDVVLVGNTVYCLTAYHNYGGLTPSVLYKYDLTTGDTSQIDLGDIVIARSLTYDEQYGLYINVIPYYYYGWIEEVQTYYYVNYGGGIYLCEDDGVELILSVENGVTNSGFSSDGTMYVVADKGMIYVKKPSDSEFSLYVEGLHKRLKNISFSNDEALIYVTTRGGGTYRIPSLVSDALEKIENTITFVDWDGTVLSVQNVIRGEDAILPDSPVREADLEGTYTFVGWDCDTTNIQCDMIINAEYSMEVHSAENMNYVDATCTEIGYSGDLYCSKCGMLLETGYIIEMTECTDENTDGYCDQCYTRLAALVYQKASVFANGSQYLITYSGDMLNNELQILPFTANYSGGYYWIEDVSDDRIWIYKDGYIYSVSDGKLYYLTVQYTSFYSYTVAVTEDISQAVQWTYNNGSLYTNYSNGSYTTNLYLYMSGNKVKVLRNRNTKIVLYEQVQIAL